MLDLFERALSSHSFALVPLIIFIGGFLGSPHCAVMCGPVALQFSRNPRELWAYQLGRMLSYSLMGALAGFLGSTIYFEGYPVWASQVLIGFMGLLIFIIGLRGFWGLRSHFNWNLPLSSRVSALISRIAGSFHQHLSKKLLGNRSRRLTMSSVVGGLTVFLPCGHLYAFVLAALATMVWWKGALVMFAFWAGSSPLLIFGGRWLQSFLKSRTPRTQKWGQALIMFAGVLTMAMMFHRSENFLARASSGSTPALKSWGSLSQQGLPAQAQKIHPSQMRCH